MQMHRELFFKDYLTEYQVGKPIARALAPSEQDATYTYMLVKYDNGDVRVYGSKNGFKDGQTTPLSSRFVGYTAKELPELRKLVEPAQDSQELSNILNKKVHNKYVNTWKAWHFN